MRILTISDMHFGVPESKINNNNVRKLLINCMKDISPIDRIILLGDIFDLDFARLGDSIDGKNKKIIGIRKFLNELNDKGVNIKKWTYIPGNHDYDLFDIPARIEGMKSRFLKKTKEKIIYWPPRPWEGSDIAPKILKDKLEIQYPHFWGKINGKYILFTHGHYFDPSQTLGNKIEKVNRKGGIPLDKFFSISAQYQGLARLVSYQGKSILVVSGLYKTGEIMTSFIKKVIKYGSIGLYRGNPLNQEIMNAASAYIYSFGPLGRPKNAPIVPDALIFGHTHAEGMVNVNGKTVNKFGIKKGFTLINDGGFVRDPLESKIVGSFVVLESIKNKCNIKICTLNKVKSNEFKMNIAQQREI